MLTGVFSNKNVKKQFMNVKNSGDSENQNLLFGWMTDFYISWSCLVSLCIIFFTILQMSVTDIFNVTT